MYIQYNLYQLYQPMDLEEDIPQNHLVRICPGEQTLIFTKGTKGNVKNTEAHRNYDDGEC